MSDPQGPFKFCELCRAKHWSVDLQHGVCQGCLGTERRSLERVAAMRAITCPTDEDLSLALTAQVAVRLRARAEKRRAWTPIVVNVPGSA